MSSSAVIVIPARLASTRLPRKLLLDRTGSPLIVHTVETALSAARGSGGRIRSVLVATDAAEIADAVTKHVADSSVQVTMTRPDCPSGSDRVHEAVTSSGIEADILVNLQGDEPEMPPEYVLRLLDLIDGSSSAPDIASLVFPIAREEAFGDPSLVKCVTGIDGTALYFSRSPIPFDRDHRNDSGTAFGLGHLGIYAYRREALARFVTLPRGRLEQLEQLEQLRALEHGMRLVVAEVPPLPVKGIDTEADYVAFVERMRSRA